MTTSNLYSNTDSDKSDSDHTLIYSVISQSNIDDTSTAASNSINNMDEEGRVHTTSSLQKVITFLNYDFFMTSTIFLCCGLMFSNDVTH